MAHAWSRLWSRFRLRKEPDPRIVLVDGGIDIVSSSDAQTRASVRWRNVARILTYKVDLLTTDCICLLFEFIDGSPAVQVSEEWGGFDEIFGPLSAAFPTIPSDWYLAVMTPAFEANRRVLYDSEMHSQLGVV